MRAELAPGPPVNLTVKTPETVSMKTSPDGGGRGRNPLAIPRAVRKPPRRWTVRNRRRRRARARGPSFAKFVIKEKPLFRRRVKAAWRQFLHRTLKIPCRSVYGISTVLLAEIPRNQPLRVIDVGAHDGDFAFGLACYCGLTQGVLIEPLPHKVKLLEGRFAPPHYRVFGCALAGAAGTATLRVNAMEATSSLLPLRRDRPEVSDLDLGEERCIEVPQRTLDSVMAEAGGGPVDLLKIDVQGAEHLVLAGGAETLRRTRVIWIETAFKPIYEGSTTFAEVYNSLNAAGFQLRNWSPAWTSPTGELLQVDCLFTRR